jgi:hypothetical protein
LDATPIRSHDDLVAAVRQRQDELKISCETAGQVAGLADGHFAKLTCGLKSFGLVSLFLVLPALGLRLRLEEDPEASARYARHRTPRDERYVRADNHWRRLRAGA